MEEEGPEPARIPTSLTATLREQGRALSRTGSRAARGARARRPRARPRAARRRSGRRKASRVRRKPARRAAHRAAAGGREPPQARAGEQRDRRGRRVREARAEKTAAAFDQRPAEGRAGDHRSDRQGAAGPEGRAHHFAHRAAGPLPGLHADAWTTSASRARFRATKSACA